MKSILLDGSILSKQIANGISNYLSNLLYYANQKEAKLGFKSNVFVLDNYRKNLFINQINLPAEKFILKSNISFFFTLLTGQQAYSADIFHSPYMFLPPKSSKHINLLTVHDLINFENPYSVRNKIRETLLRVAINRADQFICISNSTKNKLKEHFPHLDEKQMHIIYQGVDDIFITNEKSIPPDVPIVKPYLLYVGQRRGYKNFTSLLNFFGSSSWKEALDILCVGGGAFNTLEQREFEDKNLQNNIKHAGFITTRQLKYLYENAFALVYTSLYEGFGLPIIEAMACRCPVLCGDFSSMKEISGNHNILMKDFSTDSFEEALTKASQYSPAQKEQAKSYAQQFTWKETSNKTLELYYRLLGS